VSVRAVEMEDIPAHQGGELWVAIRAESINCSTCLAWEREHPYTSPEKIVREQVRSLAKATSEFVMVPAIQHGNDNEAAALACLERETGYQLYVTGSVQHPEYSWLRGSPDGLTGLIGGAEAKCPFYSKTPYSVYDANKKMYLWQCYAVMEVCDIEWMDFICYINDNVFKIERVERRTGFLEEKVSGQFLPQPRAGKVRRIDLWQAWHNQIHNEFQDPVLREHHLKPLKDATIYVNDDEELDRLDVIAKRIAVLEHRSSDDIDAISELKAESETLKKSVSARHGTTVTNGSIMVQVIKKTPPLDFKAAFEFLGGVEKVLENGSDMESFRKTTGTTQVSVKPHKEDKKNVG